jgi:hypothetical protein
MSFTRTVLSQNIIKCLCSTNEIVTGHTPVPHKFKLVLEKFLYGNYFYSLDEYFELQKKLNIFTYDLDCEPRETVRSLVQDPSSVPHPE